MKISLGFVPVAAMTVSLVVGACVMLIPFNPTAPASFQTGKPELQLPGAGEGCSPFAGIVSAEDLQADHQRRRVFISALDREAGKDARGSVHILNIDDPLSSATWHDGTNGVPARFRPSGLSFFENADVTRLFVVNTAVPGIELFDVADTGTMTHLETFFDRRLNSPKDIVATGPRSFYVTSNTGADRETPLGRLQTIIRAPFGQIFHFNGVSWSVATEGLRFANGLALSPDGNFLYATESAGRALRVYARNESNGVLTYQFSRGLPGDGENINVTPSGDILIATNSKQRAVPIFNNAENSDTRAMVLKFSAPDLLLQSAETRGARPQSAEPRGAIETKPLYQLDGDQISAATVADSIDGQMFIGSSSQDSFLICRNAA